MVGPGSEVACGAVRMRRSPAQDTCGECGYTIGFNHSPTRAIKLTSPITLKAEVLGPVTRASTDLGNCSGR